MTSSTEHLHEDLDKKVCLECNRQFTGIVAACPHDNSMLVPVAVDPLIGTKLVGKYDILKVLGTGGMGVVYKGRQDAMDRIVAIKMLQAHHLSDSMSVKRFQQESKATCRLNHPHIITVYDFGISPTGQPYIVMDYLEGKPLSDIIRKEGQIGVDRTLKIIKQASEALGHAHKQGVIHRDLKPSNIVLVEYEGEKDYVKVVDFGVAKLMEEGGSEGQKLTQMGEVCGSPVYMSPEQCQGLPLDKRSDIYSMGIVLYETLTNRLPILGKTMVETMAKHINDPPPTFQEARPDLYIPERVEQVILRALAKEPENRQQSMEQLATELEMAIPQPGRSQVLRTQSFEDNESQKSDSEDKSNWIKKMPLLHWAIVLVIALGLGSLALVGVYQHFTSDKGEKKVPAQTTKTEPTEKIPEKDSKVNSESNLDTKKKNATTSLDPAENTEQSKPAKDESTADQKPTKSETPKVNPKPKVSKPKPKPKPRPQKVKRVNAPVVKAKPKAKKKDVWNEFSSDRSYMRK